MVEKLTIQEGLNKLKILDSRIKNFDSRLVEVTDARENIAGFSSKSEFVKYAKSEFQSVLDLIIYRNKLKNAIVLSNASTIVNIAGKEMTVAEAIEKKTSIQYEMRVRDILKTQLTDVENRYNNFVRQNTPEMSELVKLELVDPIGIRNEIKALDTYIDNFKADVDNELTKSNVLTVIEIE